MAAAMARRCSASYPQRSRKALSSAHLMTQVLLFAGGGQQAFQPPLHRHRLQLTQQFGAALLHPLRTGLMLRVPRTAMVQDHGRAHGQVAGGEIHHPLAGLAQGAPPGVPADGPSAGSHR